MDQLVSGGLPRCRKCKKSLSNTKDRLKSKDKWWTNCQSCRDKNTATNREKREARRAELRRSQQSSAIQDSRPRTGYDHTANLFNSVPSTAQPAVATREVECVVCAESSPARDFPMLLACTHNPEVCRGCFLEWLNQQLDSKSWERLGCPVSDCDNAITHEDVKRLAPEEVFTR